MRWKQAIYCLGLFSLYSMINSVFCGFVCDNESNRMKLEDNIFGTDTNDPTGYFGDMADIFLTQYYESSQYDQSDYWLDCFCELLLDASSPECANDDDSASCYDHFNQLESLADSQDTASILDQLNSYGNDIYGFSMGVIWFDPKTSDLQEVGIVYYPFNYSNFSEPENVLSYGSWANKSSVIWDTVQNTTKLAYFQVCYYDNVDFIPGEVIMEISPHPHSQTSRYEVYKYDESGTPICLGYCYLMSITSETAVPDKITSLINEFGYFTTPSPSESPTLYPTEAPSKSPSASPSDAPSESPSPYPTDAPSQQPSANPSQSPSDIPSQPPSRSPSQSPTDAPSQVPTASPSQSPIDAPSRQPTASPIQSPSDAPTKSPSVNPTTFPSQFPTQSPIESPSEAPTVEPTDIPTKSPSDAPSQSPSLSPTKSPTDTPIQQPSQQPTGSPSQSPIDAPSESPSSNPTALPSVFPTQSPIGSPTNTPTVEPTDVPSESPSKTPSVAPSNEPSQSPTQSPVTSPTQIPSKTPSEAPTNSPSNKPSEIPTESPWPAPTDSPTDAPSYRPSNDPTKVPTSIPSSRPTNVPSDGPTNDPTHKPSLLPTKQPSYEPTYRPTNEPTFIPTDKPSNDPSMMPTDKPIASPTKFPTRSPLPPPPPPPPPRTGGSKMCTDPHYTTFDGLKHHYQGIGYFICMAPCYDDDYLPFKVTFKQDECNNNQACITQVRITVQNDTNSNETYIFYPSATTVTRLSDGNDAIGTYECGSARCSYTIENGKFVGTFTDNEGYEIPLTVIYQSTVVIVNTTSYISACGLCGTFNGNASDDFHVWNETAQDYYILYNEGAGSLPVSDLVWANTFEFGNSWCDAQFDDACDREFEIVDQPTQECLNIATEYCQLAWDEYCDYGCDPLLLDFDDFIEDCMFDICAASNNDLPNYSYRDAINNGFFDVALDQCVVLCDYVDKPFIAQCYSCASQCEQLTNQNGCANDDCYGTCSDCEENDDGTIDNNCKCGQFGCSMCRDGWFKIDYDFPCQSCSGLFGCKSCKDFIGCEECEDGYTMVTHDTCGEDSFFNNNNKQLHYCVPSDGSDCTFGDIEDDIQDSDDNEDSKCPNVVECDTDPCDCIFDEYCEHCNHQQGCVSCMDGYYKQSWNHMCTSCSDNFGGNCLKCNDFQGCTKCDNGLSAVYDQDCGTYICA